MKRLLLLLATAAALGAAPDLAAPPPPPLVLIVPEAVIIRREGTEEMFANIFRVAGDRELQVYFEGKAAVWKELRLILEDAKKQPAP